MLTYKDLKPYQKYAIATGVNLQYVGLFLGTGLGKTIIGLAIIDQLLKRGLIENVLVVSTKKVIYNTWRQEAEAWKPTQHLTFSIIHGDAMTGPAEVVRRRGLLSDSHIKLINYEGLPWLAEYLNKNSYGPTGRWKFPFQCIIYDESTKMKHATTQRFRSFKPFMPLFEYRYILTGTPTPNGLLDLFGQMYALDLGQSLGTVFKNYRDRYMMMTGPPGTGAKYVPRKTAREAIQKRIRKRIIYMKKSDYIQLPPIYNNPIKLDLPDKLRRKYDELEREFFLELDNATVEAFSAGTLSLKLRQFLQGNIYNMGEGGRITHKIHEEKLQYVKELVDTGKGRTRIMEGIGNCIIAYNFIFEREDLLSVFPNAPVIDGSASEKSTADAILGWNKGEHPVLLFNPAGDPHGLNLQFGGNQILWYSLTWNLEHYIQLIDRLHRQRQEKIVFVHHLLFRETMDEVVYRVLTAKEEEQTSLLEALREYRRTATSGNQKG